MAPQTSGHTTAQVFLRGCWLVSDCDSLLILHSTALGTQALGQVR